MFTMFHFGVDYLHPTKEPQHDLPSLNPPKGEMASSFSWTRLFMSPTPRTYVWMTLHLQRSIKSFQCQCMKLSFVSPSLFFFVTLVFILEPHFCSHLGHNLTRLPPRCSFPNPFWINFFLSLNTTRRSLLQPNHQIPRLHYTSPRRFLCIFKKSLLHLQLKNHQEILKNPQTLMNPPILPWSTSSYLMELRMLLTFVGSPQVPFLMCTLEIPQKLQYKFFALDFGYFYF